MAAPRGGTRERLLDAAEALFAERGYEGTSTRDIASQSGDTIGSVTYHFGSKDELHREVIRRRHQEIIQDRRSLLEASSAQAEPSLEDIIYFLVTPYLRRAMKGEQGWRNYLRMMSRLIYSPKWYPEVVSDLWDPASKEILAQIMQTLPGASPKDVGYAYHFVLGCMIHSSADIASRRINRLTDGLCDAGNFEEISARLVPFCVGGILAATGGAKISRNVDG